jgi:hypothetical protein
VTAHTARLREWGTLPERYADRPVTASTIDAAGRIVALLAGAAVVVDGAGLTELEIPALDLRHPRIDTLGDGFVVADARCEMPSGPSARTVAELEAQIPHNAHIIAADGTATTTFHAGDGIADLLTGPAGDIWISYTGEASICAPDPRRTPGRPPFRTSMTRPGLIRWTPAGDAAWYAASDLSGPAMGVGCHALNVGAGRTWAYPRPGFPLVEADRTGVRCDRRTPVHSARGVIVSGDRVAFVARDPVVTFARSTEGPIEAVATAPLLLPDGREPPAPIRRTVCRDNRMWLQFQNQRMWYVLSL